MHVHHHDCSTAVAIFANGTYFVDTPHITDILTNFLYINIEFLRILSIPFISRLYLLLNLFITVTEISWEVMNLPVMGIIPIIL
jgi:hypothetical protein